MDSSKQGIKETSLEARPKPIDNTGKKPTQARKKGVHARQLCAS